MSNSKKILLVEGEADKSFFKRLCKNLSLDTSVQVALLKEVGGEYNTKHGVINHLEFLLPQLEDGQVTNIGAVVDADYIEFGSGIEKTIELVSKVLASSDYELAKYLPQENKKGIYFRHPDGLADFGLWIMPIIRKREC